MASKQMIGNTTKRNFSSGSGFSTGMTGKQMFGMGLGTVALSGLTYMSYLGHKMRMNATPEQRLQLFHPEVQKRLRHTMGYFTAGILGTGFLMSAMRNSAFVMNYGLGLTIGSFGLLFGMMFTNYQSNPSLKAALYAGFVGCTAASLTPMIHAYGTAVLFDAALCTGATMGGLGMVAWNAPSEQFLQMGGALSLGLGCLLGVGLLQMFYPYSAALYNINMYGGIALFSMFVLYDTQKIMMKAKQQAQFDPVQNALSIYLDAINLFVRFAAIMGNGKKK